MNLKPKVVKPTSRKRGTTPDPSRVVATCVYYTTIYIYIYIYTYIHTYIHTFLLYTHTQSYCGITSQSHDRNGLVGPTSVMAADMDPLDSRLHPPRFECRLSVGPARCPFHRFSPSLAELWLLRLAPVPTPSLNPDIEAYILANTIP